MKLFYFVMFLPALFSSASAETISINGKEFVDLTISESVRTSTSYLVKKATHFDEDKLDILIPKSQESSFKNAFWYLSHKEIYDWSPAAIANTQILLLGVSDEQQDLWMLKKTLTCDSKEYTIEQPYVVVNGFQTPSPCVICQESLSQQSMNLHMQAHGFQEIKDESQKDTEKSKRAKFIQSSKLYKGKTSIFFAIKAAKGINTFLKDWIEQRAHCCKFCCESIKTIHDYYDPLTAEELATALKCYSLSNLD